MKNVLVILPYVKLFPPENGGQLRCFYLLEQISKEHNVFLVLHQNPSDFESLEYDFTFSSQIKIYSSFDSKVVSIENKWLRKIVNLLKYRIYTRSIFSGTVDSNLIEYYKIIKSLLIQNKFDFVLLEHLVTLNTVKLIRKYSPNSKIVLDAHNVDFELMQMELENSSNKKFSTKQITSTKKIESSLYKKIDLLLSCSETDKIKFINLNKKKLNVVTIPNGVDTNKKKFIENISINKNLLFCGALNTDANYFGLKWFVNQVLPEIILHHNNIVLNVIGFGGEFVDLSFLKNNPNIHYFGKVDNLNKYYEMSSIAIAPLHIGSGSRLKILEAMSFGLPVVATSKGAEGIDCKHFENILIGDTVAEFASFILQLIENEDLSNSIRLNGRKLVDNIYSWNNIGKILRSVI